MTPGMVSVILPTSSRPERVEACVRQILNTLAYSRFPLEIICCVDADHASLEALIRLAKEDGRVKVLWNGTLQGPAKAWNSGARVAQGEYFVLAADDLWFTDGWLTAALTAMAVLPEGKGLVGLYDGHPPRDQLTPDSWCTHWIAHRQFLVDYMGGVMAFEAYRYGYNDTEAWFRATRAGRYVLCADAYVRHDHYDYGERPKDALDEYNRSFLTQATEVFHRRQAEGFPDDFEPVIIA
jgi:glycosyltransferase involved in cell wall biosynthesis